MPIRVVRGRLPAVRAELSRWQRPSSLQSHTRLLPSPLQEMFADRPPGPAWRRGVCGVWGRGRWGQAAVGEACGRGCCVLRAGGSCCRVGRQRQVGLPRACPSPQAQSRAAGPEIGQFVTGTWERRSLGQPGGPARQPGLLDHYGNSSDRVTNLKKRQ